MAKAQPNGVWTTPLDRIQLVHPEDRSSLPSGAGWRFEPKYDGFRLLAERRGPDVRLRYRNKGAATGAWPEITKSLLELGTDHLVVDGEVVVPDADRRPRFELVQGRATLHGAAADRAARRHPAIFCVFDLLALNGRDLRGWPLHQRKAELARVLQGSSALVYVDDCGEDLAPALLERSREVGEGVVGKQSDSQYRPGAAWVKIKYNRTSDFVVVGYTATAPALHVAAYVGKRLTYFGRVRAGFVHGMLERVIQAIQPLAVRVPPCAGAAGDEADRWVEPRVVVELAYVEITSRGVLRHPSFRRIRADKTPEECPAPAAH